MLLGILSGLSVLGGIGYVIHRGRQNQIEEDKRRQQRIKEASRRIATSPKPQPVVYIEPLPQVRYTPPKPAPKSDAEKRLKDLEDQARRRRQEDEAEEERRRRRRREEEEESSRRSSYDPPSFGSFGSFGGGSDSGGFSGGGGDSGGGGASGGW